MQKKLIALAVAGLVSGGAFAQSNVSIYGVVDAYVGHNSADNGQSQNVLNSGGLSTSRIGFKGTEALGNGLSAIFALEYGLNIDQNQGIGTSSTPGVGNARQQYVGLKSDTYGTLIAGRLQSHSYNAANAFATGVGATTFSAGGSLQKSVGLTQGTSTRFDNAIAYVSPTFAGFTGVASYTFASENTTSDTRDGGYELGANYNNGPLAVSYVYAGYKAKGVFDGTVTDDVKDYANFLGASYDFGVAKLKGSYQTEKLKFGSDEIGKAALWQLGVDVPVTAAGTIRAGYAAFNDKTAGSTADDAKAWTLGYTHALSKRTTAYAAYTQVKNDGAATYSTYAGLTPSVGGGDSSTFGVGVSHAF